MERKTPNSFNDPVIRKKAIENRLANTRGKRGGHKFADVPDELPMGMWETDVDSRGQKIGKKERLVQRERAVERLEAMVDVVFDTAKRLLEGPTTNADIPKVHLINKFIDKLLPDLRTDLHTGGKKVTQILIGGPLQKTMSNAIANGHAVAAQITEEPGGEQA